MKFTVYRPDTGAILRFGECIAEDLALQAGEGEAIWPDEQLNDTEWQIVDGEKVALPPDLAELDRRFTAAIDNAAEGARAKFITITPSQGAVYLAKEAEARAFIDNPELAESQTPHLALEAARTGQNRAVCAAAILTKATEWRQASAGIEALRLAGKAAVRAAATAEGKRAAADIDWSTVTG